MFVNKSFKLPARLTVYSLNFDNFQVYNLEADHMIRLVTEIKIHECIVSLMKRAKMWIVFGFFLYNFDD